MATESWGVPSHKQGEEADAKKYTGTTSKILRGEQHPPFGIGTLGVATQEKVTATHNGEEREVNLVAKYFTQRTGPDSLESAVAAFKLLKEAGVEHIPITYRQVGISEVLMTDYNRDNKVAVGGNRNEKAKNLRVTSITNFPELLASIGEDLRRVTDAGISIFTDSYFFIIPISGGDAEVNFVIGDLGGIGRLGKYHAAKYWHEANTVRAKFALQSFIFWHVVESRQAEYENQILKWTKNSADDALANEAMDRGSNL
mgnify:CR=1 FL=1